MCENVKKVAILGSTGSIGTQALDIIRDNRSRFAVEVLAANTNVDLLVRQVAEFEPNMVVIADDTKYMALKAAVGHLPVKIFAGRQSVEQVAELDCVDIVVAAMVGFAGLLPVIKAVRAGKTVALANKESLVVGGHILCDELKHSNAKIIPVDSEHSAIFQCLAGEDFHSIDRLILTASGGPFRGKNRQFLENVTPEQALKHPNWNMGKKVTIDSASMMNKGLEIVEAHWLFGVPADKIDVIVHPQSVVHSLVEFHDGSLKAQIGIPDMRVPIQYALNYPCRPKSEKYKFSFAKYQNLTFEPVDTETFRSVDIAYRCLKKGGNATCVMNAANEVAVDLFLHNQLKFNDIPNLIEDTVDKMTYIAKPNLDDCLTTDHESRIMAANLAKKYSPNL